MKKVLLAFFSTITFFTTTTAQIVNFTPDNNYQCMPLSVNFDNKTHNNTDTTKMTFKWYFGDGDSAATYHASHTYTAGGQFYPTLMAFDSTGAFFGQYSDFIQVYSISPFYPLDSSKYCPNELITFFTNDPTISVKFYFGDGDSANGNYFQHSYAVAQTYTVTMIINHLYCGIDTVEQEIIITNSATPIILGLSTNLFGTSCPNEIINFFANYGSAASSFHWNFGDGDTSNASTPGHMFADTGTYKVIHTIYNSCGNSSKDSIYVTIVDTIQPNAGFFINNNFACPYSNMFFQPSTFGYPSYEWDFGDGNTSTQFSPQYFYGDTGTYNVRLIVTNGCGYKDTMYNQAIVQYNSFLLPNAMISFSGDDWWKDTLTVCPGEMLGLYNNSWAGTAYGTYSWNFDDGSTTSSLNVTHSYSTPDTFEISMIITNGCLLSDTAYKWVIADTNNLPDSTITALPPDTTCPGGIVYFFDQNNNYEKGYTYSIWYGDGDSTINITEPDSLLGVLSQHAYPTTPGTYYYTFIATNLCGNSYVLNDSIVISNSNSNPFYYVDNSSSSFNPACTNENVYFTAAGGISYKWYFGDGDSATGQFVSHKYTAYNTYTATAVITNGCGSTDTITTEVFIQSNFPNAWFSVDKPFACGYDTITFLYQSSINDSSSYTFMWTFGDGDTSYAFRPKHVYTTGGTFMAMLEVTNGCGNSSQNSIQISIDLPAVNFNGLASGYCVSDGNAALTGLPAGGIYSGAGVSGNSFDPAIAGVGTHVINYMYTKTNGCYNSDNDTTDVYGLPVADAGSNQLICTGGSVALSASGGTSYSWSPSGSLSNDTISNPVASPTDTTLYYVVVTDGNGCSNSDSVTVIVAASLTANAGLNDTICLGENIVLNGSGGGNYSWSPAASLNNSSIANPIANPTATTNYTLTVSSGSCSDDDIVIITVDPCTGVKDITGDNGDIYIYPNPTTGIITLEYPANGWMLLEILDITGKLVYSKETNEVNPEFKLNIDLNEQAKGIYNVRIMTNDVTKNQRLIIK